MFAVEMNDQRTSGLNESLNAFIATTNTATNAVNHSHHDHHHHHHHHHNHNHQPQNETLTMMGNLTNGSEITDPFLTRLEVSLLTSLFVLTIIGNAVVIFILLFYRNMGSSAASAPSAYTKVLACFACFRINSRLSRMSFYIVNLSVADMSVAFLSILPQIFWRKSVLFYNYEYLCKFVTFSQIFSVYASTFITVLMAYDRYLSICQPEKKRKWNLRRATTEIIMAWLLAALVSSPQLYLFGIQRIDVKGKQVETCFVKWPSRVHEGLYILFHLLTQFLIPFIILIYSYVNIFVALSKNTITQTSTMSFDASSTFNSQMEHYIMNAYNNKPKYASLPTINQRLLNNTNNNTNNNNNNNNNSINRKKSSFDFRYKIVFASRSHNWSLRLSNSKLQMKANRCQSNGRMNDPRVLMNLIEKNSSNSNTNKNANNNNNNNHQIENRYRKSPSLKTTALTSITTNYPDPSNYNIQIAHKQISKSKIIALNFTITIMICYILCTLPFYITTLVHFFNESKDIKSYSNFFKYMRYITILTNLLFQLNSCANPFIYLFFNGNICKIIQKYPKGTGLFRNII